MPAPTLAVDFGTSNSAVAVLEGGMPRRVPLESGRDTLPTAVFFPEHGGPMRIGARAAEALTDGDEGRYMRALKSVLGTSLFHESRLIAGRRRTLSEVVTAFIAEVKHRAEAVTGERFARVLSGRPVHFHSSDPARDAAAADDLAACYRAAGFEQVEFMFEPEAAALARPGTRRNGEIGLVFDIGGGTSDFSVFRAGANGLDILASHGVRLGGTDFDRVLSLARAMPALGMGGTLRRDFGAGLLPVPNAIFVDLATWARIPFIYTPETRRAVADMVKHAVDSVALGHLATVLEHELGHELAFAVEAGKIAANGGEAAAIDMAMIAPGLEASLPPDALTELLARERDEIVAAAADTLDRAGIPPEAVDTVFMVGGSSLMGVVEAAARETCPGARIAAAGAFTAVVDGLALALAS